MAGNQPSQVVRFGEFELDLGGYELRRKGRPVKLERRPMDLLILLIQRKRQLVTRSEIVESLWGKDVFVDVEMGVNTAMRKVRMALMDDAEAPRYIETVPGKGYRFTADAHDAPSAVEQRRHMVLAVLPFENLGCGPEREYVADGLTEEAIAAVGQIDPENLSVIGRTSVMIYKKTTKPLSQIGAELGAGYLLEGSVRSEAGRMRVTARLIEGKDQVQLWSGSYDSEPESVLGMQRELSRAIAEQIRLQLSRSSTAKLARRRTKNREAYDLYLQGRHFWNQLTPATTRKAVECYRRAVELDPEYALAWSGLSDAYASAPITGDAPPLDMLRVSREAAGKAVNAAPQLAEAQTSLGFMNVFLGWDWKTAEAAFRTAIELDPNYPLPHRMLGVLLAHMNRYDEAIPPMRRARELDPQYAMHHALSAQAAFMGRDFRDAARFAKQAIVVNPEFWIGHVQLGQALGQLGEIETALGEFELSNRLSGGNSKSLAYAGFVLARAGRLDEAREILKKLKSTADLKYVPPCAFALVHAGMNASDEALSYLEQAVEVRDVHLIFIPTDVRWDSLREEARFQEVVRRCGFA